MLSFIVIEIITFTILITISYSLVNLISYIGETKKEDQTLQGMFFAVFWLPDAIKYMIQITK